MKSVATAACFDPGIPGTPEIAWRESLGRHEVWAPRPGPLLVVSPHPDDEVFGAGGLMRMWRAWGYPVTLLSVTDGEAAYPEWAGLGARRQSELRRALGVLSGEPISTLRLGLPDGRLAANRSALEEALAPLCEDHPTVIAPYERDGHPDHEAVGQACLQVAHELELPIVRYPIWAWHHRHPSDFEGARFGRFAFDAATRAAKERAMGCFISQLAPGPRRIPIVPAHVVDYFRRDCEAFVL